MMSCDCHVVDGICQLCSQQRGVYRWSGAVSQFAHPYGGKLIITYTLSYLCSHEIIREKAFESACHPDYVYDSNE